MTTYRFWSGLETIGGNIVEIKTSKARVICDFGLSVASNVVDPIESKVELENKLQTQIIPPIPELFDTSTFEVEQLKAYSDNTIETVMFVSHLHLDHMGALRFLPKDITVYMSEESFKLYRLLAEVDEDTLPECEIKTFKMDESIKVQDIKISPQLSDHDAKGSCALFIETEDLKLIHSGDFRLDGHHSERVIKWAEKARNWNADVMLIEGTSYSFDDTEEESDGVSSEQEEEYVTYTEALLLELLDRLLYENTRELVVLNPYIRNVERLDQLNDVVSKSNRTMVWEEPYAYILNAFYPDKKWTVLEESSRGKIDDQNIDRFVSMDTIKQNPEQFILQNSYKNLTYLKGFNRGVYLHSNGEPLGDYDPRFEVLQTFLENEGLTFVPFGASGHASREDLITIAKTVSAKQTIPWHSFNPAAFLSDLEEAGLTAYLPDYGVNYSSQLDTVK